mmetsp:Transcript_35880/g.94299  ORF Transcript_35880/g.94299 Transcript_35880/m.94299 type:complete len:143 (+) Transcript_35880:191-619(+)
MGFAVGIDQWQVGYVCLANPCSDEGEMLEPVFLNPWENLQRGCPDQDVVPQQGQSEAEALGLAASALTRTPSGWHSAVQCARSSTSSCSDSSTPRAFHFWEVCSASNTVPIALTTGHWRAEKNCEKNSRHSSLEHDGERGRH